VESLGCSVLAGDWWREAPPIVFQWAAELPMYCTMSFKKVTIDRLRDSAPTANPHDSDAVTLVLLLEKGDVFSRSPFRELKLPPAPLALWRSPHDLVPMAPSQYAVELCTLLVEETYGQLHSVSLPSSKAVSLYTFVPRTALLHRGSLS
jgi:hypothetical protein